MKVYIRHSTEKECAAKPMIIRIALLIGEKTHTEGILTLLREQSVLLYMAGILSLILVPASMMIRGIREKRKTWTGVGLYYALMMLSAFFGSFPVPFMGYGASPILGYSIVICLL